MRYSNIKPLSTRIPAARQQTARHYGVHPYFTRRAPNVVRAYIEHYSQENDLVLDPFGGTGVTAIESFLLGRRAIHNDINPFANFITRAIADTTLLSTVPLSQAFERVEESCVETLQRIESEADFAENLLARIKLPENIALPRNSDAKFFYEMFTSRQLAGLAVLKEAIDREENASVRDLLLLAWSASVAKLNKTFLSAKGRAESRGGSSIFSIYRYKLASKWVELPIWETFRGRFLNVIDAKEEVLHCLKCYEHTHPEIPRLNSNRNLSVFSYDAAELGQILPPSSVDYIFTDPPYGGFISYLDLSILWNHWLGFKVSDKVRKHETIVGGNLNLSEEHYKKSLAESLKSCFRLLRPNRWISIVFQHWDLSYFSTILETADECGGELKAAITQTGDVIWSMHKKKNSASVLAGEMIITFYKPARPKKNGSRTYINQSTEASLSEVFDACLKNEISTFTNEALFNRIVIELWRRRSLNCLLLDHRDFSNHLEKRGWNYNSHTHLWSRGQKSDDFFS